jgi:lactate dehydrogenase-like 2-hydroxyacid dehydrogenase
MAFFRLPDLYVETVTILNILHRCAHQNGETGFNQPANKEYEMKYTIIGSGSIGTAIARKFALHGLEVHVANTRGPASLQALV